jgi:hemolysin III
MQDGIYQTRPIWGLKHPVSGLSNRSRTIWHTVSASVFGGSMVLLFLASTAYHLFSLTEEGTRTLRKIDHSMIYVFIAANYTPVCLLMLRSNMGLYFLSFIWALALAGIALKLFCFESSRWIRIGLYFILGGMSVLILPQLWRNLPTAGIFWLFLGLFSYASGSVIYALKRPNPSPRYFGYHEIWHFFVLGGSACQFWLMSQYVL